MPAGRSAPRSCALAGRDHLSAVVELLDDVFVRAEGRTLSLADRYPHVLREPDESVRIFVAPSTEDVRAVTVTRSFNWDRVDARWRGVAIGLVATAPHARGSGLASGLLEHACRTAEQDGADFACLWTTNPAFYRRLGWLEGDVGTLGETRGQSGPAAGAVPPEALDRASISWVEAVRSRHLADRIERVGSYSVIPNPADRIELLRVADEHRDAYAIVGRTEGLAILYELVGSPVCFARIWSSLCADSDRVVINGARDASSQDWLEGLDGIAWRTQSLAMWLPLSETTCAASLTEWYVPFLDRI